MDVVGEFDEKNEIYDGTSCVFIISLHNITHSSFICPFPVLARFLAREIAWSFLCSASGNAFPTLF